MARARLFALPSWNEAFGLVYTEAMAQGTPVVACRGEGPQDFIEDGVSGYLVPARDAGALADVIARVLDDPGAAQAVGQAGRAVARTLTWERNARAVHDVYEQVLDGAAERLRG
jgi:teichuronic acid biosynthesis glycosyltransferase TuaC